MPRGKYSYNFLTFGLISEPNFFQEIIYKLLKGISGVECLMYDIIIYGENKGRDKYLFIQTVVLKCL